MLAQSIKVCCIKSINVNETDILTIRQNNSEPSEMFVLGSESGFLERRWIVSDIPKKVSNIQNIEEIQWVTFIWEVLTSLFLIFHTVEGFTFK